MVFLMQLKKAKTYNWLYLLFIWYDRFARIKIKCFNVIKAKYFDLFRVHFVTILRKFQYFQFLFQKHWKHSYLHTGVLSWWLGFQYLLILDLDPTQVKFTFLLSGIYVGFVFANMLWDHICTAEQSFRSNKWENYPKSVLLIGVSSFSYFSTVVQWVTKTSQQAQEVNTFYLIHFLCYFILLPLPLEKKQSWRGKGFAIWILRNNSISYILQALRNKSECNTPHGCTVSVQFIL